MTQIKTKIDEFTSVLIPDTKNIESLELWRRFANRIMHKIERQLHFDKLGTNTVSTSFPAGYTSGLHFSNNYLAIAINDDSPRMGIILRISAKALTEYMRMMTSKIDKDYQVTNIFQELNQIASEEDLLFRLTKIDATCDMIDYPNLTVDNLYSDLLNGKLQIKDYRGYKSHSSLNGYATNGVTDTFYIGSRKAGTQCFLRVYNKKQEIFDQKAPSDSEYEQAKSATSWVRFECVNKGERAHKITNQVLSVKDNSELSSLIYQLVSDKFRFFDTKLNDWYFVTNEMLKGINTRKDTIHYDSTITDDIDKKMAYFFSSSAGLESLMYIIKELRGKESLNQFLEDLKEYNENSYVPSTNVLKFVRRKKLEQRDLIIKQANPDDEPPI